MKGGRATLLVAVMAAGLAGCVTPPRDDPEALAEFLAVNDPFEPYNRVAFGFNDAIDSVLLEPVAIVYRDAVPVEIRSNLTTLLRNLRLPWTAVNSLLQGKVEKAGKAAGRFATNAITLWLGDLMPGEPYSAEDAGQTLAVLTGGDPQSGGPYLVLPLLGPSNFRDALGTIIDTLADPIGIVLSTAQSVGRTAAAAVDDRSKSIEQVRALRESSLDFYATVRSLYRQRRAEQIRDGAGDRGMAPPVVMFEPFGLFANAGGSGTGDGAAIADLAFPAVDIGAAVDVGSAVDVGPAVALVAPRGEVGPAAVSPSRAAQASAIAQLPPDGERPAIGVEFPLLDAE